MGFRAISALYGGQLAILTILLDGPKWLIVMFLIISFLSYAFAPTKTSPAPGQGGNDGDQ